MFYEIYVAMYISNLAVAENEVVNRVRMEIRKFLEDTATTDPASYRATIRPLFVHGSADDLVFHSVTYVDAPHTYENDEPFSLTVEVPRKMYDSVSKKVAILDQAYRKTGIDLFETACLHATICVIQAEPTMVTSQEIRKMILARED